MTKRGKESSQKILIFCIFSSVLVHAVAIGSLVYHFSFPTSARDEIVIEENNRDDRWDALEGAQVVDFVMEMPETSESTFYFPSQASLQEGSLISFLSPSQEAIFSLSRKDRKIILIDPKESCALQHSISSIVTEEKTFSPEAHDQWIDDWKNSSLAYADPKDSSVNKPSGEVPFSHPHLQKVEHPQFFSDKQLFSKEEKLGRRPTIFLGDLSIQKQLFAKGEKSKRKQLALEPKSIELSSVAIPIPSLKELKTISCSEDFSYELVYSPAEDGEGYVFALTLVPLSSQKWKKMHQNFFFVIDTSNSITEKRLTATCNAVGASLSHLDEEDAFNIITFDHGLHYLFDGSSIPDGKAKKLAKSFLSSSQLGSFFTQATYQLPFEKIYSYPKRDQEIHSIILLTNGQGLDKSKNYSFLKEWSKFNQGNCSLYTISLDSDPSLGILDFFSSVNRGKLFTASSDRGLRRQIQKLVHSIKDPIAKNVEATIYPLNSSKIHLSFPGGLKPHIFADSPYVILGKVSALEDFDLFLQGRNADRYFNMKKRISFTQAKEGGRPLLREWALHKTYPMYQKFLYEGSTENLQEVKKLLSPYSLQTAF